MDPRRISPFGTFLICCCLLSSSLSLLGQPAASPATRTLSGRVLTPDGKPAPAAVIRIYSSTYPEEPRVAATATSDAGGAFVITLDPAVQYPTLTATAASYAVAIGDSIAASGDLADLELRLAEPTTVRVTFLAPDGSPAEGLTVRCRQLSLQPITGFKSLRFPLPAEGGPAAAVTDATGMVTIPDMPRAAKLSLAIDDPRFADLNIADAIQLSSQPTTEAKPIQLRAAASIRGRVSFPDGKPVAAMRVMAQAVHPSNGYGQAVTDADGNYTLARLSASTYNLLLDLERSSAGSLKNDWAVVAHERVSVSAGQHLDGYDFRLVKGSLLTGRVLAEDNDEPVPAIYVGVHNAARPRSGAAVQQTYTAADGTYSIRVPPGAQYLYLGIGTPPRGFLPLPNQGGRDVSVEDGQTLVTDFKLPRNPNKPITGTVLDPDGNPLAGASVTYHSSRGSFGGVSAKTDAYGRFDLQPVEAAGPGITAAYKDWHSGKLIPAKPGDQLEIRLLANPRASISGQVVDAKGNPVPNASLTVSVMRGQTGTGNNYIAGPDGRFTIPRLTTDARYGIQATAEGFGRGWLPGVTLEPGEARELPPIVLPIAPGVVEGVVTYADGKPAPNVQVQLRGKDSGQLFAVTDDKGKFRFPSVVVNERIDVVASPSPASREIVQVSTAAGDTNVRITFSSPSAPPAAPAPVK